MRELIVDVKKDNACFIDYIYNKISLPVKTVGGVCVLSSKNDKIILGIAVSDECFEIINKAVKGYIAEVLAVGYKNRYLRQHINIDSESLIGKILLDTMCIFDSNYDAGIIRKQIDDLDIVNLDGCYNFRIGEIKDKWNDIVSLSNSYKGILQDKEVIFDFIAYLMGAVPSLCDTITVIVSDKFDKFELMNSAGMLLDKFKSFSLSDDIRENIIFNLICYNPNLVVFCGEVSFGGDEFSDILFEFFNVREFLSEIQKNN